MGPCTFWERHTGNLAIVIDLSLCRSKSSDKGPRQSAVMQSSTNNEHILDASNSGGPSNPVNIPGSIRDDGPQSDHDYAYTTDLHELVGSPENLSSLPSQGISSLSEYLTPGSHDTIRSPRHSNTISPPGPSRPFYPRSATYSAPVYRQRTYSPTQAATAVSPTNNLLRFSQRERPRREDREWTVFGELMNHTDESGQGSAFGVPLPRPTATEGYRDVLSLNTPNMQRASLRELPSPVSDLHNSMVLEEEGRNSPDNFTRSSTISGHHNDDIDDESSHDISQHSPPGTPEQKSQKPRFAWLQVPTLTPVQRNILKCSIAYLLGSLFTFSPYLSRIISDVTADGPGAGVPSPSGHMVATV